MRVHSCYALGVLRSVWLVYELEESLPTLYIPCLKVGYQNKAQNMLLLAFNVNRNCRDFGRLVDRLPILSLHLQEFVKNESLST